MLVWKNSSEGEKRILAKCEAIVFISEVGFERCPFRLHGLSFKVTVKPDCVWIVMVKANQGTQETVASARAKLQILDDVLVMERAAFRARLERMLRQNGFEI